MESSLPPDKWVNSPALGQRKPQASQVHPAGALYHSLFRPSPLSADAPVLLWPQRLPNTDTHTSLHGCHWRCHSHQMDPLPLTIFLYLDPRPLIPSLLIRRQAEGQFSALRPIYPPCFAKPLPSQALVLSNTLTSPCSFSSAFQCAQVSSNVKTTNTTSHKFSLILIKPSTIIILSLHLLPANCPEDLSNLTQDSQDLLLANGHRRFSAFI